jgi:vacuolar-type H+-ATPase subunit I/STV1
MYFLALILKEVAKEIYFSKVLSKHIAKLGYLMLLSELVTIIYAFFDIRLFGNIRVEPQILESLKNHYFQSIEVYFNPTIDTNIYIILLGVVLVLFTKIVERGRALEEENDLTI